ncbi:MAG: hypothetical protein ACYCOR_17420 [Acidobacteriaceae bacterium]
MEDALTQAINSLGREVIRTHPYDLWKRHGFLDGQRYGMEVLAKVPKDAR